MADRGEEEARLPGLGEPEVPPERPPERTACSRHLCSLPLTWN